MAATPAITTSSGTPNPKSALQVKPLLFILLLRGGLIETLEMEQRDEEEEKARCCCCVAAIGVGIEIEEQNETQFIIIAISSILCHCVIFLFDKLKLFFLHIISPKYLYIPHHSNYNQTDTPPSYIYNKR